MTLLLVLRPEPGAAATRARAKAAGFDAVAAPLFAIVPVRFALPATPPEAVLLTSANAARMLDDRAAGLAGLPVYAVGAATAAAARAAGFADIRAGDADAAAIVARAAADGAVRLLHLAGRDHRAVAHPGVAIDRRIVYAAEESDAAWPQAAAALGRGAIALLHSARAARAFARRVEARSTVRIAAIGAAVAEAAGAGWAARAVAEAPSDAALLAAASRLSPGVADG